MAACELDPGMKMSVLDIACGNLRFETFLAEEYSAIHWRFHVIDNCELLVQSDGLIAGKVNFIYKDIIADMLENLASFEPADTSEFASSSLFDIVVSFGFMHHIPSFYLRIEFLKRALSYVKPGGHLIVSFWQFLNDELRCEKIEKNHKEALKFFADDHSLVIDSADLEPDDYLLGWKDKPGQYRYCHHFTDEEIDRLIDQIAGYATLVDSFTADGKTGNQNRYVILCRSGWPLGYFESIESLEIEYPIDLPPEPVSSLD